MMREFDVGRLLVVSKERRIGGEMRGKLFVVKENGKNVLLV